jgi:hypothetical protein
VRSRVPRPSRSHGRHAHRDHPGIKRFDYFRHLIRVRRGEATRESLFAEQDRYDTHFVTSPVW